MDKTGQNSIKTIKPSYLKKGDQIAITCTAFKLPKPMNNAIKVLQSRGLEVISGETTTASFHQFGHVPDNHAIILCSEIHLKVDRPNVNVTYV